MKKGMVGILGVVIGAVAGVTTVGKIANSQDEKRVKKIDKFRDYYNLLNQWLILKQEGKSLEEYFVNNGYKSIAIYGMGEMGNRLYDELKGTDIEVKYAIDREAVSVYSELEVLELEDDLKEVDAIIVTAIFAFEEIEEDLMTKIDYPIISLDDVVFGI